MPTGYTADLYEGKDVTFEEFVLNCARAFGAFIYQRDNDPKEAPKLLEYDSGNWYEQSLKKALARRDELENMSEDEINRQYLAYVQEKTDYARDAEQRRAEMRVRYDSMLRKVKEWDVSDAKGTLIPNLKDFMIEQLESSIKFDTSPTTYGSEIYESAIEWYDDESNNAIRNIEYYTEQIQKEKAKVERQNAEAIELYKSLRLAAPQEKIKV